MSFPPPDHWIPFLLSAGVGQPKWNVQRFLEAVIIAAFTGAVTVYATQEKLSVEILHLSQAVNELRSEIKEIRSDVYAPRFRDVPRLQTQPPPQ